MVSDQEIAKGLETVLRQSNPQIVTSFDGVVQELESKLGLDLSHKTAFIRDQINLLLRPPHPSPTTATSAATTVTNQPPLPIRPQPQPPALHHHLPQKDHFTHQHHPQFQQFQQFQQFPPHFALHPQHHHQVFPQDLNFRQPQVSPRASSHPQHQRQQQPLPPSKNEVDSQNVTTSVPSELAKESAPVGAKRRGGPGGLNKVCGVSPELQVVVGEPALPRTEIVRQLWAYIRKHNLQDPSNKRKIICDDALRIVFETDCTDMFKMNRLLSKHIIPLEPSKESTQAKRAKLEVEPKAEPTEPGGSVVVISDALAKFLGADGVREMTQLEASRRVWEYIKVNQLEDPLNSMVILCDVKLRELLGCESISAVGVEEMLSRYHLLKRS